MINESVQQTNRKLTDRAPRLAALTSLIAGALLLTSCPTGVDWSDYDGVNLIADRPLGSTDADGNSLWYFAEGLEAGTVNPVTGNSVSTNFVALAEVPESEAESLPAGVAGPIYRYEIPNLLPHGGFEGIDDTNFGTLWNRDLDGTDPGDISIDTADPIYGSKSLVLATTTSAERAWIDLDDHLIGDFPASTRFAFNLDFRSQSTQYGMVTENGTTGSELNSWNITRGDQSVLTTFSFPGTFFDEPAQTGLANVFYRDQSVSPEPTQWSIGGNRVPTPGIINAAIDRLTVVRADQSHYLRVSVPYRAAGRPDILSGGQYRITLWVRQDPTAGSNNRMAARALSVGIDTSTNGDDGSTGAPILARTAATDHIRVDDATDWTQLQFTVSPYVPSPPFDAEDDRIAFDLVIEIGNSNLGVRGQDAGSILLADPQLTWSP